MSVHPNATPPERHALDLEPQALLAAILPLEGDSAAGGDDTMPW
jgi:hypothetical protein